METTPTHKDVFPNHEANGGLGFSRIDPQPDPSKDQGVQPLPEGHFPAGYAGMSIRIDGQGSALIIGHTIWFCEYLIELGEIDWFHSIILLLIFPVGE
jgi:hypothetical protein